MGVSSEVLINGLFEMKIFMDKVLEVSLVDKQYKMKVCSENILL